MTTAEQIIDLSNQMRELRQQRAELIEIRKTESEFKIGEKVKVYDEYGAKEVYLGEGYVSKIYVFHYDGSLGYSLFETKKDGTASKNFLPTQGKVRLEKID